MELGYKEIGMQIFIENPLLLLFLVSALGYALGNINFRGINIGVSGVLFVGLAFGAMNPDIEIPQIIVLIGLVVFVYTIGLQSAAGFFKAFKLRGFRDIWFIAVTLAISAAIVGLIYYFMDIDKALAAGIFAGAGTNTAALASILDLINNKISDPILAETYRNNVVIGYSISYPSGVFGVLIALIIMQKAFRVNFKKESDELKDHYPVERDIQTSLVKVKGEKVIGSSIREVAKKYKWKAVFGRLKREGETILSNWDTVFKQGDEIMMVGYREDMEQIIPVIGEENPDIFAFEDTAYTQRRIFVSNPEVSGKSIASLNLSEHYNVIISRVRRGDIDLIANNNTILELGDRVRVLCRRNESDEIKKIFGDSYDKISHVNLFSFGIGITLGLLLGLIEISFPGGLNFSLGYAGGPLVVSLILGGLRRSGPFVWVLPYSANLTLRQFSLILLLAGVGVNSGHSFYTTFSSGNGAMLFAICFLMVLVVSFVILWIGFKWFKIPYSILSGMAASQPAVSDFASKRAGNKLPNIGYTTVLPIALILKILIAQLIFTLLPL